MALEDEIMNLIREVLESYRDLKTGKKELDAEISRQNSRYPKNPPVIVLSTHVIELLRRYQSGELSESRILEWVNTVWFSGWFEYADNQSDSIASVMNELEELDEEGKVLTKEMVEKYIGALEKNAEV